MTKEKDRSQEDPPVLLRGTVEDDVLNAKPVGHMKSLLE